MLLFPYFTSDIGVIINNITWMHGGLHCKFDNLL